MKRLDIHNLEFALITFVIDNLKRLNEQLLDTDDYLSNRTTTTVKKVIEDKFKRDLKLVKRELKLWNRRHRKDIRKGYISADEEFDKFLSDLGVNVDEYYAEVFNQAGVVQENVVSEEVHSEEINEAMDALLGENRAENVEVEDNAQERTEPEEPETPEEPEENGAVAPEVSEEDKPEEPAGPVSIDDAESLVSALLAVRAN